MRDDFEARVRDVLHRRGAPDDVQLERVTDYIAALPPRRSNVRRGLAVAASIVALVGIGIVALPRLSSVGTTTSTPPTGSILQSSAVSSSLPSSSATALARLTCGGDKTFPASGMEAPLGAEKASGPEFDALRAAFATFTNEFPGAAHWAWRLAGRDEGGAIFLATPPDELGFVAIELASDSAGWHPTSIGYCNLFVLLPSELKTATWSIDPAFPVPAPDSTELHVLVWERQCASGMPATGRVSDPTIIYTAEAVTIVIGVRPMGGAQRCPSNPGTPTVVHLTQPLGHRTLLDGGPYPAVSPSPAF